ncbi:uncharacterized protein LOC121588048 [Anopheles merus]|uniref:uncharacterized protein LOC121588048 n=1 Tax=Anopheles merus TaxID=30066 RepID=UPI001BE4B0CC|nr:uncharacterized protein LOC121588048 [Anopheles merus]
MEVAAEVVASEKEEAEAKETVAPVTMMKTQQQNDDVAESAVEGEAKAAAAEEAATAAVVELAVGESRKRSQDDHSRRSRSSSSGSSSTSSTSNGGSNSLSEEASSGGSTGSAGSNSNSDSEGVSSAKKVKLETVVEQQEQLEPPLEQQPKMVDAEPTAAVVVLEEKKASECSEKSSDECHEANDGDVAVEEKSMPEEKPMEAETSEKKEDGEENAARMVSPAPPPAEPVAVECKSPPCAQEEPPKAEPKGEEEKRTETLLLPPPPPPPPAQPVTARVPAGGKASIVAPVLERPDSARLTADLQSCQRQLAEVRSKYDVTRKELHATKRKLKRMSVRLGNMTTGGGGGGSAASGGIVGGAASPHALAGGPADDDRNRKWREPMIVAAMKIKNAMGIQAYKSLIKDGELLLPSLRTITRYLESLRKAGGGAAAAAAVALASAGTAKPNAPMEVDELPEDEEDEDVEEEDDDVVAVRADGLVNRRLEPTGMVRKKQPKANGAPRTVDHNRNEQRRHPAAYPGAAQQQRHHHHGPEVQDIKTEQDPVSFTASPDINYYQHNADEDEDEDEDGYRDPTSLLEGCRYEDVSGMQLNGEDGTGYHYAQQGQQQQQQQTLSQAQIEFLKSMVGFRKKWTPYELRTCNDIRRIIGSREYESLRRKDGMPLPSVKTLRKYRQAAQLPDTVDVMGRKRKHNELEDSPTNQSRAVSRHSAGGESGSADHGENGSGVLFPFGNDIDKEQLKPEQDPDGGHFDVSLLTIPQINFLQTLTMNTKGFSDYELQRSLELKNELGSGNYETLRKQEFLNIPTLAMLTRYEQDNGLEDLSRLVNGRRTTGGGGGGSDRKRRKEAEAALELARDQEEQRNREIEEQRAREQQQQEQEQEQQRQLELYNRLTQADPSRHPLFDSIAGDASPTEGADPAAAAAAIAAAMAAAAAAGLHPSQLEHLNGGVGGGGTVGGEDSSLSMFEHHSIFDKDTPMFDMTKLSPAHVEFLNTLPENPKRWTQEMINSALDIKNEIGTRDYEILRRQGIPLPAARTLRRHKDIRNKADRAMSETGEILPASGPVTTPAGVVGGSG